MINSNSIRSILLLAASCLLHSPANAEQLSKTKQLSDESPCRVYQEVWELISKQYFDPSFNNQNWLYWKNRYKGKLITEGDEQKAIDTMLASLGDRYTRYLNKASFEEESTQIAGKLYGIGVQIAFDAKSGKLIVVAPIEGSPAAAAGFMPGDQIEEIDGKPTRGLSIQEASNRIRGALGSIVTLTIFRQNERKVIQVTRGEIQIKSVQTIKMLNSDIGYIRLSTFMSSNAGQEVQDALVSLSPARGIILDLRENPGGLVSNAIDICSLFIRAGVVVSTVDRSAKAADTRVNGRQISSQPLVVLIDQGSASAAEITSGALKDTGRADLVGSKRSFGKGLVQSVSRLSDGSGVNITIARYLTPNGNDINKKGIVPDYVVDLDQKDYTLELGPWWHYQKNGAERISNPLNFKDIQLKKAVDVMNNKLKSASQPYELKLNVPFNN
ncbi:MAG: S41 family peptidase [Candidatus Obscuribacterales bacterium]|nr:S41 family peptidase [Candidatus Obscuribacterales bacterium]